MALLIAFLFFIVFVPLMIYLMRKRQRGLVRVAQEMGFAYEARPEDLETEGLMELPLLKRNTGLSDLLRGRVGMGEALLLDVRTGGGRGAQIRTVALYRLAGKRLPVFELRPHGPFGKLGAVLGLTDIHFESNPRFSRRYRLQGPDSAAVRELFHSGRLLFFERNRGWSVEGAGEWLAVYRQVFTCMSPKKVREFLEETGQVAAAFV